jgi:hypothetical protein
MTSKSGFGKVKPQPKVSQRSVQRAKAAQQFDSMKTDGVPEFEIYIRIKDKKQWFPVGAIAVKRSSQINQAIFANQNDLREGAFRLFPVLRKSQANLEYGYRCKDFKDEPIQLAVQPEPGLAGVTNGIQAAVGQLGDRVAALFKR